MRVLIFPFLCLLPIIAFWQSYRKHTVGTDRLSIELSEGILSLIPLTENAVRVTWEKGGVREEQQFVLIHKPVTPKFNYAESSSQLRLSTSAVTVVFNKKNGALDFMDYQGKVFLSEKPGSRKLVSDVVLGESCFVAEQGFSSPEGESLFGLGQFQDGNFNLRNVSRKLTQVNSQIAIPFLYSSRGYGILWHQYGLTHFNPADNMVPLVKRDTSAGEKRDVEVTTTAGTQRVSQQQSVYHGKFFVAEDGEIGLRGQAVKVTGNITRRIKSARITKIVDEIGEPVCRFIGVIGRFMLVFFPLVDIFPDEKSFSHR